MTTVSKEVKTVTGTLFKGGYFRYEQTINVHYDDAERMSVKEHYYHNEYSHMFQIGEQFCMNFVVQTKRDSALKELPQYIIYFYPEGADCDEEQIYFINTFEDLNRFFKEMQPMVEIAKYLQERWDKEDE